MESLKPPKTFKAYTLIKQTGLLMTYVYIPGTGTTQYGPGFYATRDDAEHGRTMELLKETSGSKYHVFELEIPNPVYQE